jgi:hypothetical protein
MVSGYVGILILVCFSFTSCYITLVESIDGSGNHEGKLGDNKISDSRTYMSQLSSFSSLLPKYNHELDE